MLAVLEEARAAEANLLAEKRETREAERRAQQVGQVNLRIGQMLQQLEQSSADAADDAAGAPASEPELASSAAAPAATTPGELLRALQAADRQKQAIMEALVHELERRGLEGGELMDAMGSSSRGPSPR